MTLFKILNTPSLFFNLNFSEREGLHSDETWDLRRSVDEKDGNRPWTFSDLLKFFKGARRRRKNNKKVNGDQEKGAWAKRMTQRQGVLSLSYLEFGLNFLWLIAKKEFICCLWGQLGEEKVVVRMSQLKLLFLCCLFILQLCEWLNTPRLRTLYHKLIRITSPIHYQQQQNSNFVTALPWNPSSPHQTRGVLITF